MLRVAIAMLLTLTANTTFTYADFQFQIVASPASVGTAQNLAAPDLASDILVGSSQTFYVYAVKDTGNTTTPATISAITLLTPGDTDITFSFSQTSANSFTMENADNTSTFGTQVGTILATVANTATISDTRNVQFRATITGLNNPNNNGIWTSNTLTITAVPEPSSLALVGLVGVTAFRMRRRRVA